MTTCQLSSMPRGWGCETAETRTARKPWEIEDGLWERVEPLLPVVERTIFMSYRSSDVAWAPDLVYAKPAAEFGEEAVFKAGNNPRAGDEYPSILEEMAASCPVMLARLHRP